MVDDVFQYIFNTVDLSIDGLIERNLTTNSFGRIDKVIAKSFKSRVSIYYASPMFNGNTEIFSSFTNENGEHYFNQIYDETKWNLAAEYTSEAIQACLDNGLSLYEYNGQPAAYDYTSYSNSNFIQKLYDLRSVSYTHLTLPTKA